MDYIMSLPVDDFLELLAKAAEERRRAELRQQWLTMLPWMKEPQSWEDFYAANIQPRRLASRRSKDEILGDVAKIRQAVGAGTKSTR